MPTRSNVALRPSPRENSSRTDSLRARLERLAKKPRPSLVGLIDSLPVGTRTKEDIDREFEELRGSSR